MLIDANHLGLTLNGHRVLQDVNLHLESGRIYGLLGPNGAGKSTTIAILLDLYPLQSGQLALFDTPFATSPPTERIALRSRIGVMPEHAGFYDWMSADDYLYWYAGFYGGMQQPLPELLEQVGLAGARHQAISQFSRGMRQRLGLARALLHGPELLILDEPTNGLDPRGRREIHDLLLELAATRRVGILLCTHLLDDVDRLCTDIGIMHRGNSVLEGPLNELVAAQQSGRRFRLRLAAPPADPQQLPAGISLLSQEGPWWQLSVDYEMPQPVSRVWQDLLERGWPITEIHAASGTLEDLYLRLTAATGSEQEET